MKSFGLALLLIAAAPVFYQTIRCFEYTSTNSVCNCIGAQYVTAWKTPR